jgi:hypothetical protein
MGGRIAIMKKSVTVEKFNNTISKHNLGNGRIDTYTDKNYFLTKSKSWMQSEKEIETICK